MNNIFVKILCSIPIILIAMYFIPFFGICLLILRYFVYSGKKASNTPKYLLVIGILLLFPKLISYISKIIKIDSIPYLNEIATSKMYIKLLSYSKLLLIVGVIFLIVSFIGSKLGNKIGNELKDLIAEEQRKDAEISEKNDLKIKEKQERAKNTRVVHCPHCGSDNIITEKAGICKYCRRHIE